MTAYKHPVNGAWIITDIIDGYYVSVAYYFTTKKDALRKFREEYKKGGRKGGRATAYNGRRPGATSTPTPTARPG